MATTKLKTAVDMKLEIVVLGVSDVDRAKAFYEKLGWRLDADFAHGDDWRVLQFTPPGSGCSVIFGKNVTAVDLIYEGGIANMNYSISNTAEYGEYVTGPRIVTSETKAEMKRVLNDIQSGKFARDWMLENKVNQTSFKATRAKLAEHPIEEVGAKLRDMMPWIKKGALVDKTKN